MWWPPLWSSPLPTPSLQLRGAGALPVLKPSLAWPAHRHDTVISILVAGTLRSEAPLRDMAGPVAKVAGWGLAARPQPPELGARTTHVPRQRCSLQPCVRSAARALTVAAGSSGSRWQHSSARPCRRPPPHWSSQELVGNLTQTPALTYTSAGATSGVLKSSVLSMVLKHLGWYVGVGLLRF